MANTTTAIRTQFFDYLFGDDKGYLCLATASALDKKSFKQFFFNWPEQRANVATFLESATVRKNVWFCTSLLERSERKKEYCKPGSLIWADLDTCNPDLVEPAPPCVIETSPHRWQALWRLKEPIEPYMQEDYNRRIAYKYSVNGADPSGWDLTQLLRVPLTFNYKYETEGEDVPEVKILRILETRVPEELFKAIEKITLKGEADDVPLPDIEKLASADTIVYKYWHNLSRTAFRTIYTMEPPEGGDWSGVLWRLINICMEAGMSNEESLVVALNSKCNKYARDNRPVNHLWKDILRADVGQKKLVLITKQFDTLVMPELTAIEQPTGFIEDYKSWAIEATDAVEQYHELSAAILLSSVLAGGIKLDTTYGEMYPNLWGLVLGDSTLTRKTTAMRMAMDIVTDIDSDIILATDGSAEGLLTGLSNRPNQTSVFYKDEVSGFVDSINRKDYLAGMPETLTQLYDVPKLYTRRLRKETISISSPVFIFFGGGIRDKVYSLLSDEYVLSGFLPRFLVVSGEADLSRIRRTGPATSDSDEKRANIVERMRRLRTIYTGKTTMKLGDQDVEVSSPTKVVLTGNAWRDYGEMEMKMVKAASDSQIQMLALPTFERMSRSLLKLSVLLAASQKKPKDNFLHVDEKDVANAAYYIQRWGGHSIDLLHNAGKGMVERTIDKLMRTIQKYPEMTRSRLMRSHNLTSREANELIGTLEDRGMITVTKEGRGQRIRAV